MANEEAMKLLVSITLCLLAGFAVIGIARTLFVATCLGILAAVCLWAGWAVMLVCVVAGCILAGGLWACKRLGERLDREMGYDRPICMDSDMPCDGPDGRCMEWQDGKCPKQRERR